VHPQQACDVSGDAATFWAALDDVVMGGTSASGLVVHSGAGPGGSDAIVFSGIVSTANNGGFASVRSKNFSPALDLGGYEGLRVTLRGDGQRYKLILRTTGSWDATSYCVSINTPVSTSSQCLYPSHTCVGPTLGMCSAGRAIAWTPSQQAEQYIPCRSAKWQCSTPTLMQPPSN
jgi:hypothetical protein